VRNSRREPEFKRASDLGGNVKRLALVSILALVALVAGGGSAVAASAPSVTTGKATSVTQSTATVNCTINPHGVPTAFYFEFGKTTSYGTRTNTGDAGSGTSSRAVSASLTGLSANTTYHYRLVAFSAGGTSRGSDRTFKTPQIPTTSTINVSPNPAIFGGLASVTGVLTGPSASGKQVALQGKLFPFTGPFTQIGNTVLTTADGGYSFLVPLFINVQLRVVDQSKPSVTSPTVTENVALAISLKARRVHRGLVRFSGHVRPSREGNAVLIQKHVRGGWRTVGITLTRRGTQAAARFTRNLRLHKSATFRAVVRTRGGDYVDGTSRGVRASP
jgi:hypothetical protein